MTKKYYPVFGGEIPSIANREGKTYEEVRKCENTLMCLVTLKRMKEKIINYLEENDIAYTKIIISPSLDLLISEEDIKNYPQGNEKPTYNWGMHLDIIPEYVSVDLSCVVYENGDEEEFIPTEVIESLGINLTPIIVNYRVFVQTLTKQELGTHNLPDTFGSYKMRFIEEEAKETLGYNLNTDILIKEKTKRVI